MSLEGAALSVVIIATGALDLAARPGLAGIIHDKGPLRARTQFIGLIDPPGPGNRRARSVLRPESGRVQRGSSGAILLSAAARPRGHRADWAKVLHRSGACG